MKKLLMLMVCCFVAMPSFAAKCPNEVDVGQWFLENKGTSWNVQHCEENSKGKARLEDKDKVQPCDDPNANLKNWKEIPMKGNATLLVKGSAIIKDNTSSSGNLVLNEFFDKNTACIFCDSGYTYNHKKARCEEDMRYSCTELRSASGKGNEYLSIEGGNGWYVCGQGNKTNCAAGHRIFALRAHQGSRPDQIDAIWTCHPDNKTWTYRPAERCNDSRDLYREWKDGRADREVINTDGAPITHSGASSWVADRGEICLKYTCKKDYVYVESEGKCIQNADYKGVCTGSGGRYDDNIKSCSCPDINGLKLSSDGYRCECKAENHIWDNNAKKCIKDPAVEAAEQAAEEKKKADQQAAIDADAAAARQRVARQKACEESGGSFDGKQCSCFTEKNQKFDGVEKCICITNEYRFDNKDTGCVITDNAARERLCKMAGADAFWNGSECRCYDKDKVFVEGKTACEKPDYIIKCEKSKGAYWDSDLKECLCTVEGYVWNKKDACEKGAGLVAQEIQAEEERTRKRIADLTKDLFGKYNEMVSDVSVWKNKEGEFNTARLASDSIAGVVLGTAGGLITSNVVKKSQVKSGFEDVQCTIGGQKVADWGDEFTVGIQ